MKTSASRMRLAVRLMVPIVVLLLTCSPGKAAPPNLPDFARYQVNFGAPAGSATDAIANLDRRKRSVIDFNACGQEIDFFVDEGQRNEHGKPNADIYPQLIAKIMWLALTQRGIGVTATPTAECIAHVRYFDTPDFGHWQRLPKPSGEPHHGSNHVYKTILDWPSDAGFNGAESERAKLWNKAFADRWPECDGILRTVTKEPRLGGAEPFLLEFRVGRNCIRAQIDSALKSRQKVGNPGTTGLPCTFIDTANEGDWDMAITSILRATYLDRRLSVGAIKDVTNDIFGRLLTISGPLEPHTYGLHECGNTENDTGPPQERSDEDDFYDNDFFRGLGDIFEWLLKWLLLVVVVAVAIGLGVLVFGPIIVPLVGIPVTIAIIAATQVRIPETENHLLMINSARYLTNQLGIELLTDEDDKEDVRDYQAGVKEWLLQRLQQIASEDFMEYNSKPYQSFSLAAILNLHDFADDAEIKTAARIVLDYTYAKFAAGSNQGRRLAPFRRLMETNRLEMFGPREEGMRPRRITDFGGGADHPLAAMLLYVGQAQQLPAIGADRLVSIASSADMMWEASSSYVPHEVIVDLAINKSVPYDQYFHHDGFEIYSSGKSFLITAGGVITPNALGMSFTPLLLNVAPPFGLFQKNEDRGAAVPTTLMVPSGSGLLGRNDLIRFDGPFVEVSHGDRNSAISNAMCETDWDSANSAGCKRNLSSDHNLCVRKGFACGVNLRIPGALQGCVRKLPTADAAWSFVDSTACPQFAQAAPFYLVLFTRACPGGHSMCTGHWGFFEAVDRPIADADVAFNDFMQQTVARNPNALLPHSSSMVGEYNTWRGEKIFYAPLVHENDSDRSGITAVNNQSQGSIDDWKLAFGDAVDADGEGRITIRSPGRAPAPGRIMRIRIDFSDWESPKYEELQ